MANLEDAIMDGESAVICRADRQAADAGDLTPVGAQRVRALPAIGGAPPMTQGRPTPSGEAQPERASLAAPDHGNVFADDEPPPDPDPRLVELTRILARMAAREWYRRQRQG
jgi:hypothetical protein